MVKRTIGKFKKALAAAMTVVMVCSSANPLYADMGFINQPGGGKIGQCSSSRNYIGA